MPMPLIEKNYLVPGGPDFPQKIDALKAKIILLGVCEAAYQWGMSVYDIAAMKGYFFGLLEPEFQKMEDTADIREARDAKITGDSE